MGNILYGAILNVKYEVSDEDISRFDDLGDPYLSIENVDPEDE